MSTRSIKTGDTHKLYMTVTGPTGEPVNLIGSTVKLLMLKMGTTGPAVEMPIVVDEPALGRVYHQLAGDLEVGVYLVEVELTRDSEKFTSPSSGVVKLRVERTLDAV